MFVHKKNNIETQYKTLDILLARLSNTHTKLLTANSPKEYGFISWMSNNYFSYISFK